MRAWTGKARIGCAKNKRAGADGLWLGPCAKDAPVPKGKRALRRRRVPRAKRSVPVKARAHAMVGRLRMHWSTEEETGIFYSVFTVVTYKILR